ncbi:MAG TPA: DUF3105 domain-containing protein [Solirubrobacterales bacterium]|nr:DUF3105 domain-containing protein [Solirubrobacterales bacterium]
MASRKEERERRRAERLAAERSESAGQRLRLILGYAIAGLIGLAVVAGLAIALTSGDDDGNGSGTAAAADCEEAFVNTSVGAAGGLDPDCREGTEPPEPAIGDLEESAEAAGCRLRLDLPEEGAQHFTDESNDPGWETNPPTSGDHYGVPTEPGSGALADGAYAETPPLARAIHSMEHGRVVIHYSPDLPEEDQLAIKGLFDQDPAGMIMFPNPEIPFAVAAAAWQQLIGCPEFEGAATLDALRNFRDVLRGRGPENVPVHVPQ